MNSRLKIYSTVVLALSLALLVQISAAAATYQLSGKITNQSGSPLAGVVVDVIDPATGGTIASATTDTNGIYLLSISEGTYNVEVTPPANSGFGPAVALNQSITSDKNLDFVLVPAGTVTLSGRVLDRSGNGIPGQQVRVMPWGGGPTTTNITDASGNYSLTIAPGSYQIRVYMNGNNSSINVPYYYTIYNNQQPFILEQSTTLDLTIPAKKVSVHVQDPAGNPVANARLTSTNPGNPYLSLAGLQASGSSSVSNRYSDANGDVTLWLFPTYGSNTYTFTVYPPAGTPFAMFTIGNVTLSTDKSMVIILQFIHAPPSTTATLSPGPNPDGNYPSDVTVSLSATAIDGFTVTNIYYIVDNGLEQNYSEPFVVTGDGTHTIRYWSIDDAGVYETPKTRSFTIQYLRITTGSPLPDGKFGETYATMLAAAGGISPYSWSLVSGSLPPGLQFNQTTGEISGSPASEGTFSFTIQATDSSGVMQTAQKAFQLRIHPDKANLNIQSSSIVFNPARPDPNQSVTISAAVSNLGFSEADAITVSLYDFDNQIGEATIAALGVGQTQQVSFQTTYQSSDLRLLTIKVDPTDAIPELDENDNQASQLLLVGSPDPSQATLAVQASPVTTCRGKAVAISGQAFYDFASVPGTQDYPVQGGNVLVTFTDPATNAVFGPFTGAHTDVNGYYSQGVIAPGGDGIYPVTVQVSDMTISIETQTTLTVSGACPDPGDNIGGGSGGSGGGGYSGDPRDVYVLSEDILFSKANPDKAEAIQIFAWVQYNGSTPAADIPVYINDIYPVDGVLKTYRIAESRISFSGSGSQAVYTSWSSNLEGAHVIQVVVEPLFDQYTKNDKATRAIFVGNPPQIDIQKTVALLTDVNGDGNYSPGDTLQYTLEYQNTGAVDVTGAVIIDDFDEQLLETPVQVSDGGTIADGEITWNLGSLVAGASGSVTYQVNIRAAAELPAQRAELINHAVLDTDQTPPVIAFVEVEVIANRPPTVDSGGPYSVNEGGSVDVSASGSDPDGDLLSYAWDLDNDGSFETPGQSVTFSAADLDGPGSRTIAVQVTDPGGLSATDQAEVNILNVAPTASFVNTSGEINEGESVIVAFSDPYDPGAADTTAGFLYSYDCTNDGTFETSDTSVTTFDCSYPDNGIFTILGRIKDKDGGFTDYTVDVTVHNVAPLVGPISATIDPVQVNTSIDASADFTDSGILDTHTAVWDWGDGNTSVGTVSEMDGSGSVMGSHTYTEPGVYTIKLTVTDKDGDSGASVFQFVVVFNPDGGFVTGGGWIDSPAGAYVPDPSLSGHATFGFSSNYKKGTTVPTGSTKFQFHAAGFNFRSSDYEWLVVAGAKAMFKGSGTINGEGSYKFMISAIDGQINGGGDIDKFRIKIWEEVDGSEQVIYDNQLGAAEDEDPNTAIGGGSIVIH